MENGAMEMDPEGKMAPCPCFGVCKDKPVKKTDCMSDADCGADQHCSVSDGDCLAPPGCGGDAGFECPAVCYGICVDNTVIWPPVSECNVDADCKPGYKCEMVDCVAPPCEEGEACPAICELINKCVKSQEPPPSQCDSDTDCKPGFVCQLDCWAPADPNGEMDMACLLYGTCVPGTNNGCSNDAECGDGMQCVIETVCSGASEPVDPDDPASDPYFWEECQTYGVCQPKPTGCTDSSECPAGQICLVDYICPPCYYDEAGEPSENGDPMPPCEPCIPEGICVDEEPPISECYEDSQCGPGYYCQLEEQCPSCSYQDPPCMAPCQLVGKCVPKSSECQVDSDCGPGYICTLYPECGPCPYGDCLMACPLVGICEKAVTPSECYSDAECGPGFYCQVSCAPAPCMPGSPGCGGCTGTCVPMETYKCLSNADCPAGYTCKLEEICVDYFWCDPSDPNSGCGECFVEGYCVMGGCEDVACPDGEILDTATCQCVPSNNPCFATGCSGEICASESIASDCMWAEWYICLSEPYTKCGPYGPNGTCMWQPTEALKNCLNHF
jgi:eight-cysteine-cluster-containing protein